MGLSLYTKPDSVSATMPSALAATSLSNACFNSERLVALYQLILLIFSPSIFKFRNLVIDKIPSVCLAAKTNTCKSLALAAIAALTSALVHNLPSPSTSSPKNSPSKSVFLILIFGKSIALPDLV